MDVAQSSLTWYPLVDAQVSDLLEFTTAVHLHTDVVHGDRCCDYPPCKRRILVYRRIPHLQLSSFLFDSMHVLELGVLANLFGSVAWRLIHQGCFGRFTSTQDADHIDEAMTTSVKAWYKRAGHTGE